MSISGTKVLKLRSDADQIAIDNLLGIQEEEEGGFKENLLNGRTS